MRILLPALGALALSAQAATAMNMQPLSAEHRVWQCSEFTLSGVPQAANPYDPDVIAVDVTFTGPSGRGITLPAFWYQAYSRQLVEEETTVARGADAGKKVKQQTERLTTQGQPGWRVRFTPVEAGPHRYRVVVRQAGAQTATADGQLSVGEKRPGARGFVRVEPKEKRYFALDDGTPLPLLGECACWHGRRGTADYDDWFAGFESAGMNYTRLWMWPTSFGVEVTAEERLNYNQQRAWRLDYVLDLAARKGIHVMLCMDYHGIFQVTPDMWGGNNWWPKHAYNQSNGGPCATQNDFFTNEEARSLYRKRLRYLIGRYAALPSLMSWQFFNEINNVYRHLKPADVVAWHDTMARWLHANDPYRHLVTTSFGSAGEQAEMWKLDSLDYAQWHLYLNWGGKYSRPAPMAADVGARFRKDYGKPIYVGEYGTSGRGFHPENDPHFRGLHQGIWGGILGGTAGTAMPWWWEHIHREKLYSLWGALSKFLAGTGFGSADWRPAQVSAPQYDPVPGEVIAGAAPFDITLRTSGSWGQKPVGKVDLTSPEDVANDALHPFLHGTAKPDLKVPCVINAVLAEGAQLVVHVNSASTDAALAVTANGTEIFRRAFPDKDGKFDVNGEYNEDVTIPLPAGKQTIEVFNPGEDWLNVDSVRVVKVLPREVRQRGGIPLDVYGMTDGRMALVWAIDPRYNYPKGSALEARPLAGASMAVQGIPDGEYVAEWWHTREGRVLGKTNATSKGGRMELPVITFAVDVAARVTRR